MMTQEQALDVLKCGYNVFLTGEPGSGKSYTIDQYVKWLRKRYIDPAITASTGIAATHVGGRTIHSWSGIGIKKAITANDIKRMHASVISRIRGSKVLIIDEVSMLAADTINAVDAVCRAAKQSTDPFGGLQVIFVGDFFQLPPVPDRPDDVRLLHNREVSGTVEFAFQSKAWHDAKPYVCYLSEQHRQTDDAYTGLLGGIRRGVVTEPHRATLRARSAKAAQADALLLYSHNADVDRINADELAKLPGVAREFQMVTQGPDVLVQALMRGCTSPEKLLLKVSARVLFTRNDQEHRWVNGTVGVVMELPHPQNGNMLRVQTRRDEYVVEQIEWKVERGGWTEASIKQYPLRLAWALTVHKSQGMSLDAAHVDLSRAFEYGQGYVALSRVRQLSGLSIVGLNDRALQVHPEVVKFDSFLRTYSTKLRDGLAAFPVSELRARQVAFVRRCGGVEPKHKPEAAQGHPGHHPGHRR